MTRSLLILALLNGVGGNANAQFASLTSASLAGVDTVGAVVRLTLDSNFPLDSSTMRSRLQTVLELELRKHGVPVSRPALSLLSVTFIVMAAAGSDQGLAVFYRSVGLFDRVTPWRSLRQMQAIAILTVPVEEGESKVTRKAAQWDSLISFIYAPNEETDAWRWVPTWEKGSGVGTVGTDYLKEELEAQTVELAQEFANAWLAQHPTKE